MRKSKLNKRKGKLQMKNAKNTWCNHETHDGDTYKKHLRGDSK